MENGFCGTDSGAQYSCLGDFGGRPAPEALRSKVLPVTRVAVDVAVMLPDAVGVEPLVALLARKAGFVPRAACSHQALRHEHRLIAACAVGTAAPLGCVGG